jgi:ribosome biogenesis protein UTP30
VCAKSSSDQLTRNSVVPHPLYSSPQTRICLITADGPEDDTFKKLVKDPAFPKDLEKKLHKVIRYSRLAKKYKDFESRRTLFAEYDLFLADERIIHMLPAALGSTFYKSTTKRPIPVSLTGRELYGKKTKRTALDRTLPKKRGDVGRAAIVVGAPLDVAGDIERALATLAVHLSPCPTISVKVAYAGWPAEWISENVQAAAERVLAKYIPGGWRGLKSLHLKGPETAALPVWMAEELWATEDDVLDPGEKAEGLNAKKLTKEERKARKDAKAKAAAEIEAEFEALEEVQLPSRRKGRKAKAKAVESPPVQEPETAEAPEVKAAPKEKTKESKKRKSATEVVEKAPPKKKVKAVKEDPPKKKAKAVDEAPPSKKANGGNEAVEARRKLRKLKAAARAEAEEERELEAE